jgi:hypothetical protein
MTPQATFDLPRFPTRTVLDWAAALAPLACKAVPRPSLPTLHLETEHYFIEANLLGTDTLVATFERAGPPDIRPDRDRKGWGVGPFIRRGVSVLAVKPKVVDWYTRPDLAEALSRLRPLLAGFRQRVTYGTSMGALAALSHADLLAATRVVALAPQTSIDPALFPDDDRIPQDACWNVAAPFADARGRFAGADQVVVVYDPQDPVDRRHVGRILTPSVETVKLPFAGHEVPVVLRDVGALDMMVELCLTGRLDRAALGRALRQRRSDPAYLDRLARAAAGRPARLARIAAARLRAGCA